MFYISLWLSKFYYFLTKKGVINDKAGLLALKIDKNFLKHVNKPKLVIAVTGTNGKTTTCNFLVDLLEYNGYKVTSNKEGANLKPGICKALMKGVNIFNKSKVDAAVIEFDELSTKMLLTDLKPTYTVVTNLFLDTMKRNGHTDYVFNKINEGLPKDTILILNADDLISSMLGKENKKVFFGIDRLDTDSDKPNSLVQDIRVCPNCYTKLEYDYIRYHHIGHAHCPNCGFSNYKPNYNLTNIDYKNKTITVNNEKYKLVNDGIFNIYNQLVAITLLNELKIKDINKGFENLEIVKSRYQDIKIGNIEIITQLAKGQNPIASSRSLDYVSKLDGNKEVILIFDDIYDREATDRSEVMSWIYDTDFEYLCDDSIKKIIIGGLRAYDYKVRLLLAGVNPDKIFIEDREEDTYRQLTFENIDKIIIVHDIYMVSTCEKIVSKIKEVFE